MTETIKELRNLCVKKNCESFYFRFCRIFSIYFTKIFLMLKLSANSVSFLNLFIVTAGSIFLAFGTYWNNIIALVFYNLYAIFDCSDGEIARYHRKSSFRGELLDTLGHDIFYATIFIGISIGAYITLKNPIFLIFGISASLFSLLNRVGAFFMNNLKRNFKAPEMIKTAAEKLYGKMPRKLHIGILFETSGILTMLLILAAIDKINIFLIFYGVLMPLVWLFTSIMNFFALPK